MMKNNFILAAGIIAAFFLLSGFAGAVGITDGTFGGVTGVEQGKVYSTSALLVNSPNRDNYFTVSVGGEVGGWVTEINPDNFNLSAGATKLITLTIFVPDSAGKGTHTGTVTATGAQIIGGGTVGFQEATRGTIYADVTKSPVIANTTLNAAAGESVSAGTFAVATGSNVTVPVMVGNANLVAGGSVKLAFNPAIVNVVDVSSGDFDSPVKNINNTSGFVSVAVARTTTLGTAAATLANIKFIGMSAGTAILSFASAYLNYENGSIITPTISNGSISVSGGAASSGPVPAAISNTSTATVPSNTSPTTAANMINISISSGASTSQAGVLYTATVADNTTVVPVPPLNMPQLPAVSANLSIRITGNNKGVLETAAASVDYTGKLDIEGSKIVMNTSAGQKQIMLPEAAINASGILVRETVQNVVLAEKLQKPVYSIKSTRQVKLLFFMPVSMESQTDVDAETGKIISVSKPWWSAFAGG